MSHVRFKPSGSLFFSNLLNLAHITSITGTPIYGETELVDLFELCPKADQQKILPFFDSAYYIDTNKDIEHYAGGGLHHFLDRGLQEWRNPHPLIDLRYSGTLHPGVFVDYPSIDMFIDLLENNIVDPSPFFSIDDYWSQFSQSPKSGSALLHFLKEGAEMGLNPSPYFDADFYIQKYDDVPSSRLAAFIHFIRLGDRERRNPSPQFDPAGYEHAYPDISACAFGPLEHYLRIGRFEGRKLRSRSTQPRRSHNGPPTAAWSADVDVASWALISERLKNRHSQYAHDRIVQFREHDVRPVRLTDHIDALKQMRFPEASAPDIDIMIPVFNEFELTVECLQSIAAQHAHVPFRITLLDDASTDMRTQLFADIPGLRYHRHPENMHFLRSCNAGFALCDSPFLLLLNNDAQLMPGALDRLFAAISDGKDIAAVGPKILYPNGRLQESGGAVMPDGAAKMVGVGDDPAEPCYNYARDVDYISGACLLLRRDDVGAQLFDEQFAPAYCEDVDLCLRLRAAGRRVLYVPEAVVVHHLSVSTAKGSEARRLRMITANQQKLHHKWAAYLLKAAHVRVLAFYLPQFHATPENDLWWGKGFTEWTNVAKALPSFDGHYQPHLPSDLGYYDLTNKATMQQQQQLAARYGIEGFVVYYYHFKTGRILQQPLENILADPSIDFKFCPCWANENWTKHWDGGEREILLEQGYDEATLDRVCADALRFAADPRAITVNGKPLFLVYRPLLFPDVRVFTERLRAAYREAGWPEAHLVYIESMETAQRGIDPRSIGFDACVEFPPQEIAARSAKPVQVAKQGWAGHVYDYESTVVNACARRSVPYARYPTVFPSWDNTARQPLTGTSFIGLSGALFAEYVAAKTTYLRDFFTGEQQLLFVNAWNEWAEGAHLEPDHAYGHTWLEALRNGVAAATWPGDV